MTSQNRMMAYLTRRSVITLAMDLPAMTPPGVVVDFACRSSSWCHLGGPGERAAVDVGRRGCPAGPIDDHPVGEPFRSPRSMAKVSDERLGALPRAADARTGHCGPD